MANLSYQNPTALLPKTDFVASGPLGGAVSGLSTMYGLDAMNNEVAMNDLQKQIEQLKFEEAQKDVPLNEVTRRYKEQAMSDEIAVPEALRREAVRARAEKTTLDTEDKRLSVDKDKYEARARTTVEEVGKLFDLETGQPRMPGLAMGQVYPQIRARMEAAGVKGLPETWNGAETANALQQHGKAALASMKHLQEMQKQKAMIDQQGEWRMKEIGEQGKWNLKAVEQRGADSLLRYGATLSPDKRIEGEIRTELADGKPLDEMMVQQYAAILAQKNLPEAKAELEKNKSANLTLLARMSEKEKAQWKKDKGISTAASDEDAAAAVASIAYNDNIIKNAIARFARDASSVTPGVRQKAEQLGVTLKDSGGGDTTPTSGSSSTAATTPLTTNELLRQYVSAKATMNESAAKEAIAKGLVNKKTQVLMQNGKIVGIFYDGQVVKVIPDPVNKPSVTQDASQTQQVYE